MRFRQSLTLSRHAMVKWCTRIVGDYSCRYCNYPLPRVTAACDCFKYLGHYGAKLAYSYDDQQRVIAHQCACNFSHDFGTRQIANTEQHGGPMLAVAFESFVKLFALLCVALFLF